MSATNPSRRPIDEETRARIVELLGTPGKGRNAIAREVGVAGSTVGRVAAEEGHEFDWSETEAATAARRVQTADIRENIAALMLLEAHRALQALHAPAVTFQFESGRTTSEFDGEGKLIRTTTAPGEFREHVLDEPTFSDQRNLMTIAGIAVSKAAEVSRPQPGQGAEQGAGVITAFAESLEVIAASLRARGIDPTAVPEG